MVGYFLTWWFLFFLWEENLKKKWREKEKMWIQLFSLLFSCFNSLVQIKKNVYMFVCIFLSSWAKYYGAEIKMEIRMQHCPENLYQGCPATSVMIILILLLLRWNNTYSSLMSFVQYIVYWVVWNRDLTVNVSRSLMYYLVWYT